MGSLKDIEGFPLSIFISINDFGRESTPRSRNKPLPVSNLIQFKSIPIIGKISIKSIRRQIAIVPGASKMEIL